MEHLNETRRHAALIAAADEAGHPEIGKICEEILREEEAMARWLEQRIPDVAKMPLLQASAARWPGGAIWIRGYKAVSCK